jgi:hypothetical protein
MGSVICSIYMITSLKKILLIHEALLQDIKVGVWCAISATGNIGLIFFGEADMLHTF